MAWQPDGWDARTRVGLLVPHADVGPESELRAMAPADVMIHAARVPFGAMGAGGAMDPTIAHAPALAFGEPPHVDDAAELLAAAPLDVIAFGFTSSAYLLGPEAEAAMVERLERRTRGIPVVTPCAGGVRALLALGITRIAHVSPPWFDAELDALGAEYYRSSGFEVTYSSPCELPSGQSSIEPETLDEWIVQHVPTTAEATVVGGNGFRAVGVIQALEQKLGRPVLTANQALLWAALKTAGAPTENITRYGRIFSM